MDHQSSVHRFSEEPVAAPTAILEVLAAAGVEYIYGMSGGNTGHLYRALSELDGAIRPILTRHESLATVMAEAYGRLTGRVGVAVGQGSWLLTNGGVGILEAHVGSSPVVLLADLTDFAPYTQHAPYQAAMGSHGTWDAAAAYRAMTKETHLPLDPVEAVQSVQQAVRAAVSGEPGPVAVLFHSRSLAGDVDPSSSPRVYGTDSYLKEAVPSYPAVEEIAEILTRAERPVLIAGGGVRTARAYAQLEQLVEATGVAVATTASGKGVLPEVHPLSVGVMGNYGEPTANVAIGEADTIVAVGTRLAPTDTCFENPDLIDPERQLIIQIERDPRNANWTYPADHLVLGDAGVALGRLVKAVEALGGVPEERLLERRSHVEGVRERNGYFTLPLGSSPSAPIHPQRLIASLNAATESSAIVTCDAGENRLLMNRYFQTKDAGSFLQPAGAGGMGYAIPAALAARTVYPHRQVVAVCGDGGFGMSMSGLLTSLEEDLPICVIVFNNRMLGWVRHGQGEAAVASELSEFDHAEVARSLGANGIRVEEPSQLADALRSALDSERTTVVDVMVSDQETFLDIMSPLAAAGRP